MPIIRLEDRRRLEKFLRQHPYLHIYALCDLDDFFWPHTTWYGIIENDQLAAICMLYKAINFPVLHALAAPKNRTNLQRLLTGIHQNLPRSIYSHLSLGLKSDLERDWELTHHGEYLKMAYLNEDALAEQSAHKISSITSKMAPELLTLFQAGFSDHTFDPRMLVTGQYLGIWQNGDLVCAGGVHVYSPTYRVAALGNIVTHPTYRGRGMATAITLALCRRLSPNIDHIGLNVKAGNSAALNVYQRCGFRQIAQYEEIMLTKK